MTENVSRYPRGGLTPRDVWSRSRRIQGHTSVAEPPVRAQGEKAGVRLPSRPCEETHGPAHRSEGCSRGRDQSRHSHSKRRALPSLPLDMVLLVTGKIKRIAWEEVRHGKSRQSRNGTGFSRWAVQSHINFYLLTVGAPRAPGQLLCSAEH